MIRPTCALALAMLVAGCGAQSPRGELVLDDCGETVTFDAPPRRVLTIGPSAVYQLHAAGAGDRIVARAGEFGARLTGRAARAVEKVPVIDPEDPGREQIIATGADAVVHYGLFETTAADLDELGIRSLHTAGACALAASMGASVKRASSVRFDDVYRDIEQLGRLFGTERAARRSLARLQTRVARVADAPRGLTAASVYFFPGSPLAVNGNRSMTHAQLTILGVTNVFADLDADYVEGSVEALIRRDPDVLVLAYGFAGESFAHARRRLLELPGINGMGAVRHGRILGLPASQRAPDVNAVSGLETLATQLQALAP